MTEALDKWYLEQLTVPELLNRNAVRCGHRPFQMWRNSSGRVEALTYSQVWRIVRELTGGLMGMGFGRGERAAIMAHTSPQWAWCDYSILCAAGVTVCIYPTLSVREIAFIINDSGARVLFLDDEENLKKVLEARKDTPGLEKIIMMREAYRHDDPSIIGLDELRGLGVSLLAEKLFAVEERWRSVKLSDLMTIVYTSGTTGMPKGAVHTHHSFNFSCCRDIKMAPAYREGDVLLSFLPLSHTYERECGHGCALLAAVTIAYSSPKSIVEDLQVFRPMVFMSVPRIYERIYMAMRDMAASSPVKRAVFNAAMRTGIRLTEARMDGKGFIDMSEGIDLTEGVGLWLRLKYRLFDRLVFSKVREKFGGRFRFAFSAAGSLSADLCKVFLAMGIPIIEGYGATETWNTINLNSPGKIRPGSVGPVCTGIEGRIADDGEWQVRGDNLFSGYWNNEEATREAFTVDGFYRTGDIVEMLEDGYIKIVDRKKGLMVLDTGKNIPSAKIESLFSLSRYIDMVFPIADDRKFVSALVIPDFDAFIDYFREKNISYDASKLKFFQDGAATVCISAGEDFINNEELKRIIDDEIRRVNMELEEYEQIKKYYIVGRRLTEQSGEMTPTMKVKRKVVIQNFRDEIESMYR